MNLPLNRPSESLSGDLEFYWAYTLVDITDTAYSNPKGNTKEYRQAQNLNTLIQLLSLRTQLVISSVRKSDSADLSKYNFGTDYSGNQTLWVLKFASEKPYAWRSNEDNLYFANLDCDNVPVNIDLDESTNIKNFFQVYDPVFKNIYFEHSDFL